jgi:DNA-3-methyladenine glycosylase I
MAGAEAEGRVRCGWATSAPEYVSYHDSEWGRVTRGDTEVFERLSLEAFQSGLSWLTILRKREAFRAAFAGFDFRVVATYDDSDVARLLGDPGIVRNRAKVEATIHNARVAVALDQSLSDVVWAHEPAAGRPAPATLSDVPSTTSESVALARDLKRRGFRFVGPTTAYALMQAIGMVNDHVADCWVRERG